MLSQRPSCILNFSSTSWTTPGICVLILIFQCELNYWSQRKNQALCNCLVQCIYLVLQLFIVFFLQESDNAKLYGGELTIQAVLIQGQISIKNPLAQALLHNHTTQHDLPNSIKGNSKCLHLHMPLTHHMHSKWSESSCSCGCRDCNSVQPTQSNQIYEWREDNSYICITVAA